MGLVGPCGQLLMAICNDFTEMKSEFTLEREQVEKIGKHTRSKRIGQVGNKRINRTASSVVS